MRARLIVVASVALAAIASPAFAQPKGDQNSFKPHQSGQSGSNFAQNRHDGGDSDEDVNEIAEHSCKPFPGGGATGGNFPGHGNGGSRFCPPVSGE
jgi:hypothetical protein